MGVLNGEGVGVGGEGKRDTGSGGNVGRRRCGNDFLTKDGMVFSGQIATVYVVVGIR